MALGIMNCLTAICCQ